MELITERQPVDGPVVYGYLRLTTSATGRRTALSRALSSYCLNHELRLGGLFTDYGDAAAQLPGFAGLLDALAVGGSYAVVTPSRGHLGGRTVAAGRADLIARTGQRLILVDGTRPAAAIR